MSKTYFTNTQYQTLEIGISENNFYKIKKIDTDIKNDDFEIKFNEKSIKISTIFFDKIKTSVYIYLFESDTNNDLINYQTSENKRRGMGERWKTCSSEKVDLLWCESS